MFKQLFSLSTLGNRLKLFSAGGAFVLMTAHSSMAAANIESPEFSITDASQFVTTDTAGPANTTGQDDTSLVLAYRLNNKTVRLELSENTRLTTGLATDAFPESVKLYSGGITGNEASWARISRIDGALSGAIFDGETLFLVDSSEATFQAMPPETQARLDPSQPIIFRARDVRGALSCGVTGHPPQAATSYRTLVDELNSALSTNTVKEFTINIHTDNQYASNTSGSVQSNVMSQMNIVDGIFSGQLDIQFNIASIAPVSNSSSLDTNNSGQLLEGYYDYTYPNSAGLAHLFTGKSLDGGSTLGIAYVDAVCRSWGVGVSRAGGRGVAGALTVAHELGHNFGAPHDNQSGPCESTSNQYLMNPYHNNKDEFSACSIGQINQSVDRVACYVEKDGDDDGGNTADVLTPVKNFFFTIEPVEIAYNKDSNNALDWVGIYKKGELGTNCSSNNETYVDWRYAPSNSGMVSFSDLPAGNYQAQMFADDGYCFVGEPKSIMVGSFDYAIMSVAGLLLLRRRRSGQ